MAIVYFLNTNALAAIDGRLRTFVMTAVTATLVIVVAGSAGAIRFPADATGTAGLASLTVFYCTAMIGLFAVLPRVPPAATAALNFEPIALLGLAWIFLDQRADPLQIVGAFLTVGAIAWLSAMKR
jgi:drug/metabolite transporter (DMT)-like permease